MHLASEWVSPVTGGIMTAVSTGVVAYSAVKLKENGMDNKQVKMMGAAGAFVFASQMINVAVPFTGSSGHIGGGILLAALLGPYGAFLALTAVLLIQALVFSDGGLLALGCNIFNMGVSTCFIAYPLIFKPVLKKSVTYGRIAIASILASVIGLQIGAFSVALETKASGINVLPFADFVFAMQPIHFAIGIMEGLITAAVLILVFRGSHEAIENPLAGVSIPVDKAKRTSLGFLIAAAVTGGGFSLLASELPDGLEWAIDRSSIGTPIESTGLHHLLDNIQSRISFMPDYGFIGGTDTIGTITAGIIGAILTLLLILGAAGLLRTERR